ncbi:electron transfer flavoprotein subunit beta/FixA family protein [candidate division WOR-3 bacterium]|jgi:electron transfer flavoprotein beta subunit|nr:electron transfer flavoprotein subunit beta/FixA family protein [candidate division WOR-3 bacterium]
MKIVVLVKQVPDTKNVPENAMKEDGTLNRQALEAIFNPEDLNALELALELKDRYQAEVTVISMGPPNAKEILKDSLYRGADKVVLISDRKLAGSDTLATSIALAGAIRYCEPDFDIVICGRQAIDGDTAQVGPQVAEKLSIPQITYTINMDRIENNHIFVSRETDNGIEMVKGELPLLLTITKEANIPRLENIKFLMKYKKADIKEDAKIKIPVLGLNEIGIEEDIVGLNGSPTKVKNIESVVITKKDIKNYSSDEKGISELFEDLVKNHLVE